MLGFDLAPVVELRSNIVGWIEARNPTSDKRSLPNLQFFAEKVAPAEQQPCSIWFSGFGSQGVEVLDPEAFSF